MKSGELPMMVAMTTVSVTGCSSPEHGRVKTAAKRIVLASKKGISKIVSVCNKTDSARQMVTIPCLLVRRNMQSTKRLRPTPRPRRRSRLASTLAPPSPDALSLLTFFAAGPTLPTLQHLNHSTQ